MRNLFSLLWKYQFFIIFLILETFSLILLFNNYSYHRSLYFNTASDFTGKFYSVYGNIENYFSLKNENRQLLEENALLKNKLSLARVYTDSLLSDTNSSYYYIPAHVISNSVNKRNNLILIDKGRVDSVKTEMGVVSSTGIAGIVIGVSDHYAVVMSMLHRNSRISGRVMKNGQLVNIIWKGRDYTQGEVTDIPTHFTLSKGDTIITSGNSLIFPPGILIGTIESNQQSNNQELGHATLNFSTDFNRLEYVYIIKNREKEEQEKLLKETGDE
ncbi:MAG: rod shape-determining protein MreC [Chlorobi bacterium]|nr:rod shape-determining protein MreC [Chlorobiota bacterium]